MADPEQEPVIEGTLVPLKPTSAELQRFQPVMSIAQALERRQFIVEATQKLMKRDVDFGKIPGTGDKDCLLQPGADKLCNLFGLVIKYTILAKEEDWDGSKHSGEPFFYYLIAGKAYRGDFLMGEGIGSCSSWETKYRWREAQRFCPTCGKSTIIKGKDEWGGGWICWKKKGGCGAKFLFNEAKIQDQPSGRVMNPDVADLSNTIVKMAQKRCKVSTTINATSASEFFTQDILEPDAEDDAEAPPPSPMTRLTAEQQAHVCRMFETLKTAVGLQRTKVNEFLSTGDPTEGFEKLLAWGKAQYKATKPKGDTNGKTKAQPERQVGATPDSTTQHSRSTRGDTGHAATDPVKDSTPAPRASEASVSADEIFDRGDDNFLRGI